MNRSPIVGIDFDNTIVSYDDLFYRVALEWNLVDADSPTTKQGVRDALRVSGREVEWTELQGYVYGPGMANAKPFPGALEFINECHSRRYAVMVISHRTRTPVVGPAFDLHRAAHEWLDAHGVSCPSYFEITIDAKIERIARESCTHFIDDLPEVLSRAERLPDLARILFEPVPGSSLGHATRSLIRAVSWIDIGRIVFDARAHR